MSAYKNILLEDIIEYSVKRVYRWNKQRYAKKFNFKFTETLINEEWAELITAINEHDKAKKVDGVGDILFVCIGACWKAKIPPLKVAQFINNLLVLSNFNKPRTVIIAEYSVINNVAKIFSIMSNIIQYAINQNINWLVALNIVIESNDTKIIAKCLTTEKYSKQGKGKNYKSPDENIKLIYSKGI